MNNPIPPNNPVIKAAPVIIDYLGRVVQNEHAKRGIAGAVVAVLIACVVEAAWPSP